MKTVLRVAMKAMIVCAAGVLVAGCTVGPDYHPPQTETPNGYLTPPPPSTAPSTMPATQPTSITTMAPADVATWWQAFDDPELNKLIARAIESNLDLKQAEARILQARAQRNVNAAGYYPTVNTNGSYTRVGGG